MTPERRMAEEALHFTRRLDQLQRNCEAMLASVHFRYGARDERTLRAQELWNYVQRLRGALDGGDSKACISSAVRPLRRVPDVVD